MKEIERCQEGCLENVQLAECPPSGVALLSKSAPRLFVALHVLLLLLYFMTHFFLVV